MLGVEVLLPGRWSGNTSNVLRLLELVGLDGLCGLIGWLLYFLIRWWFEQVGW